MAYNRENYIRIQKEFEQKNLRAKDAALRRRDELHEKIPGLKQIDLALAETGMRIFTEMMAGKEGLEERLEKLRLENMELQSARRDCLVFYGYPPDYSDVRYECSTCEDTGSVGTSMCACMRRALVYAGYASSGIGNLMKTQSFETFDLAYYKPSEQSADDPSGKMERILAVCKRYAETFTTDRRMNLLLRGDTGLGKTHLTTSMAKVIIERGFDVVYDTAQNVFADFEYERFSRGYGDTSESRTARYFDCDLLIMDDLGTEMSNQFTVSCLYNVINTRLNQEKSVILNTNLAWEELRKRYADRITSRLFGEFMLLEFYGRDIRARKLK